ncbi:hypothetical protein IV203_032239 [Nitzschia inconspicua]|uniref:Uncharacterized protein n=1 Tax=Nitzschia inconspicua TaxID=303405 RepID=A0A9K3KJ99_9STRA|nr:hypothetical protein IV203_032239 [Nitzschia inconspicua]
MLPSLSRCVDCNHNNNNNNSTKNISLLASSPSTAAAKATTTATSSATSSSSSSFLWFDTFLKEFDHVANRVGICTLLGFFGGAAYGTLKGFPRRSTALKAASSCAIVATSVFGMERIAAVALQQQQQSDATTIQHDDSFRWTLSSHAFAGVAGGALNGYLYQKKPLRGMFYFIPIMLCVAGMELEWKHRKELRTAQVQLEQQQQEEDVQQLNKHDDETVSNS